MSQLAATIEHMPTEDVPVFTKKLRSLMKDQRPIVVAEKAGIEPQAMRDYLSKGIIPRAHIVVKIARAFGVDPGWLSDEDDDTLEPHMVGRVSPAALSDAELMDEVARRYKAEARRLVDYLDEIEQIPWLDIAGKLYRTPLASPVPNELLRPTQLANSIEFLIDQTIGRFVPGLRSNIEEQLKPEALISRWNRCQSLEALRITKENVVDRHIARSRPELLQNLQSSADARIPEIDKAIAHDTAHLEENELVKKAGGLDAFLDQVIGRARTSRQSPAQIVEELTRPFASHIAREVINEQFRLLHPAPELGLQTSLSNETALAAATQTVLERLLVRIQSAMQQRGKGSKK